MMAVLLTDMATAASVSTKRHFRVPNMHLKLLARRHPKSWNPLFPPTHESLLAQNAEIDRLGLPRIKNDRELKELIRDGELVPIPVSDHLIVDKHLPANRRYCRPWTASFLTDLSDAFYARFHEPIMVDSAVRTVEVQRKLLRWNGNAAPAEGETASSHLAGTTVDLARRRMTPEQGRWVEVYLLPLHAQGMVEVEEEYRQFCFHIMVAGNYGTPFIEQEPVELLQLPISM
jgi:hypothetical protein